MTSVMDMLPGPTNQLQNGVGFEFVTRAARLALFAGLNDEIDAQSARWKKADLASQAQGLDPQVGQIDVQHVLPQNMHDGPRTSLITSPPSFFPNFAVMAYTTRPSAVQAFDQANSSDLTLFIEAMAITGPVPDGLEAVHETIVHRRIERMTEAIAIVMERNQTLMGTVHAMVTPPQGGVGTSSVLRNQDKGSGPKYLWHGSRLIYTVTRHHSNP